MLEDDKSLKKYREIIDRYSIKEYLFVTFTPHKNLFSEESLRHLQALRDELKVKVQAEVPHTWQKELEETARELNVKKLEMYRFIFGEFLGKVRRKKSA